MIVTANVPNAAGMRVDIEILDGSEHGNVYLSKQVGAKTRRSMLTHQDIHGESRLAITTHQSADVGVCLKNVKVGDTRGAVARTVELDVDIGADATDYK